MGLNEQALRSRGKSKSTRTVSESSPNIGPTSSDTETSAQSTGQLFPEWTCSAVGSPAKISALPESEPGLTGNGAASGVNTSEPFAHFDPATSSWKTYQVCLLTHTWDVFSETWPRAGTMRNGIVYQQQPLAPLTGEIAFGSSDMKGGVALPTSPSLQARVEKSETTHFFPTPTLSDSKNNGNPSRMTRGGSWGGCELNTVIGGPLNPAWVEWLMGYPVGWTDLGDSATPSSRKSRNGSDGKS